MTYVLGPTRLIFEHPPLTRGRVFRAKAIKQKSGGRQSTLPLSEGKMSEGQKGSVRLTCVLLQLPYYRLDTFHNFWKMIVDLRVGNADKTNAMVFDVLLANK